MTARHRRNDARAFQDEILAEIDERYDAYTELEGRITRAIAQFDLEQTRTAAEILQKEQRIQELEGCLERTIDHAQAEGGALTQLESALGNFLQDVGSDPVESTLGRRDLEREMQALRGGLARARSEKDTQIQEQEATIGQLAASVARFEQELEKSMAELAVATSVGTAVAEEPQELGDDEHAAQRQELMDLRDRVSALSPYVDRLATADERIQELEGTCEELRDGQEDASNLRLQVAELEASGRAHEEATQAAANDSELERRQLEQRLFDLSAREDQSAHEDQIEDDEYAAQRQELTDLRDRVSALSPYVERLATADERIQELEGTCEEFRDGQQDASNLRLQVAELEASGRAHEEATLAQASDSEQERTQLEQRVAELSPLVEQLGDARGRVHELEQRCAQMDQASGDETLSLQAAQRDLAGVQDELLAKQSELAESEQRATTFEQRCESISDRKEEQLDVLRSRVADLETVHDELGEKSVLLDEMEERCTALERSKKRAASATQRLREELAEAEESVRDANVDPKALRRERAQRHKQLLELFDELDEVALGMKCQEERVDRLDGAYNEALCEQECDLDRLEDRVRDLYLFMEAAGDVIAQLESKA